MLTIYLDEKSLEGRKIEKWNQIFFEAENKWEDVLKNKEAIAKLVRNIDESEYTDRNTVISKFDGTELGLDCLSGGCKTAINVLLNPDKVFSTISCGYNAVDEILTLDDGQIYLAMNCITDLTKPVKVVKEHVEYIINDFDEFDDLIHVDDDMDDEDNDMEEDGMED